MDTKPIEIKCSDYLIDLCASPTQTLLCCAIVDGSLELYDYSSEVPAIVKTINVNGAIIRTAAFSMSGDRLFCGCEDGSVFLLDLEGNVVWKPEKVRTHEQEVTCVYCYDEKYYLSGDDNGIIKIWEPLNEHFLWKTHKYHQDYISSFEKHEAENCVAVTSADGSYSVINMKTYDLKYQSENCNDEVLSCSILKKGKMIVTGTQEGVINIYHWCNEEADICDRITGHPESIDCMLKVDEDTVITGSDDGVLRIVQVHPNQLIGVLGFHDDFPIEKMVWTKDKQYVGTCSHDSSVYLYDGSVLREETPIDTHKREEQLDSDEKGTGKKAKNCKKVKVTSKKEKSFFDDLFCVS